MQTRWEAWSPRHSRPTRRTLLRRTEVHLQRLLLKLEPKPKLAGSRRILVAPDTPAAPVPRATNMMPDSAIRSVRRASTASALCAGSAAQGTTTTSASSAGSPTPGRGAQMAWQMLVSPAPSAHMEEEAEESLAASLVTMQKDSAIQSAALASVGWDQSAGDSALQVPRNVALYARPRVNHAPPTSQPPPLTSSRQPSALGLQITQVASQA